MSVLIIETSQDCVTWDMLHNPGFAIHEHVTNVQVVSNIQLNTAIKSVDSLTFDIYPNNELFGSLSPYKTYIRAIYADMNAESEITRYGDTEFEGRIIGVRPSMDDEGLIIDSITCEACEAFLMDTTFDSTGLTSSGVLQDDGSILIASDDFFTAVLSQHNASCDSLEQIQVGDISPLQNEDKFEFYYAPWTYGTASLDAINDMLDTINSKGYDGASYGQIVYDPDDARLFVHRDSLGVLVADVICDDYSGHWESKGNIVLGANMGNFSDEPDYTDIVTVVRPMGEEYTDSNGVNHRIPLSAYVTAANGAFQWDSDFTSDGVSVTCTESAGNYGKIERPLVIEGLATIDEENGTYEITQDDALRFYNRTIHYLRVHGEPVLSMSLTAYDLSRATPPLQVEQFKVGDRWRVYHPLLDTDTTMRIVQRTLDISRPFESSLTLGTHTTHEGDYLSGKKSLNDAIAGVEKTADEAARAAGVSKDTRSGIGQDTKIGHSTKAETAAPAPTAGGETLIMPINADQIHVVMGDYFNPTYNSEASNFINRFKLPGRTRTTLVLRFYMMALLDRIYGSENSNLYRQWMRGEYTPSGNDYYESWYPYVHMLEEQGYFAFRQKDNTSSTAYTSRKGYAWQMYKCPFIITDVHLINGDGYFWHNFRLIDWAIGFQQMGEGARESRSGGWRSDYDAALPFVQVAIEMTNYYPQEATVNPLVDGYAYYLDLCFGGFLMSTCTDDEDQSTIRYSPGLSPKRLKTFTGNVVNFFAGGNAPRNKSGALFADYRLGIATRKQTQTPTYRYCMSCDRNGFVNSSGRTSWDGVSDEMRLGDGGIERFYDSSDLWVGYNIDDCSAVILNNIT